MKVSCQTSTCSSAGEAFGHRPHDLLAGGVAQGVDDAIVPVTALASQGEASFGRVEAGAPADELLDPPRGLADHPLHDLGIAERAAGLERVGHVVLEAVFRIDHAGDAALGIGAVGVLQAVLGDDQDREPRIGAQGGANPGQPAADDQHVGKVVRDRLGTERDEVARRGELHYT